MFVDVCPGPGATYPTPPILAARPIFLQAPVDAPPWGRGPFCFSRTQTPRRENARGFFMRVQPIPSISIRGKSFSALH